MTKFERDLRDALEGNEIEVIKRRKAEIEKLTREGKACKNSFRVKCIAQDVVRLKNELAEIEANF